MRLHLSFLFSLLVFAATAQIKITGHISIAPDNESAIGATVVVKGISSGAITDVDGNFSIQVPDRKAILVFSYTGYTTQEQEVGDRNVFTIMLAEDASQLNEVIVTGYGTEKRSNISGSVSTVSAEEFAERPICASNRLCKAEPPACK